VFIHIDETIVVVRLIEFYMVRFVENNMKYLIYFA